MASDLTGAVFLSRTREQRDFVVPSQPEVNVGFDRHNDVAVPFEGVSRRHARITFDGKEFWIEDVGSANGTYLNAIRLTQKERLKHLDIVTLGRRADLIFVRRSGELPRKAKIGIVSARLEILDGLDAGTQREVPRGSVTIGRSAGNNIVADSQLVSKVHARIERSGVELVLTDLQSANGTFVNGERIESRVLKDDDEISVGHARSYRVRLEEGEVLTGDVSVSDKASTTLNPSLPMDWKTHLEWSPEEVAEFEKARAKLRPSIPSVAPSPPAKGAAPAAKPEARPAKPAAPSAEAKPPKPAEKAAAASPKPEAVKPAEKPPAPPPAPEPPKPQPAPAAAPAPPAKPAPELPKPPAEKPVAEKPAAAPVPVPPAKPAPEPPKPAPEKPAAAPPPAPSPPPKPAAPKPPPPPAEPPLPPAPPPIRPRENPREATRALTPEQLPKAFLESAARTFPLALGSYDIGRDPAADIHLPSNEISRRHARLRIDEHEAVLEDLKTVNGTSVNGQKLVAPRRIADGDEVMFGSMKFRIRFGVGYPKK